MAEICVGKKKMKKVFLFMLALISLQIQAQKINIDKQDGDVRKILTYAKKVDLWVILQDRMCPNPL